jgi:hypothetical protein
MNSTANNQEQFQTNSAIHSINKGINTIFTEQLPIFHAFRKGRTMMQSEYSAVNPEV